MASCSASWTLWRSGFSEAVDGDVAVEELVEANVLRRWVAKGEGVGEVRGGSSRRRER
jgi:hypothetical protein